MGEGVVLGHVHGGSFVVGRRSVFALFEDPSDLSSGPTSLFQPCYQKNDRNGESASDQTGNVSPVVIRGIGDRVENDGPPLTFVSKMFPSQLWQNSRI